MASPALMSKANTTFSLDLLKKLSDDDKTANVFFSPFSISSALAMVMLGARGNTATQMAEVLCFTEAQQAQQAEQQTPEQQTPEQQAPEQQAPEQQAPEQQAPEQQAPEQQTLSRSPMQSQIQTRRQMQTQIQQTTRLPQYLLKCLKPKGSQDGVHAGFAQLLSKLHKADTPYALSAASRLYGEQSYQFIESFLAGTRKHYSAELEPVDFKSSSDEARVNINSWVEEQTQGKIKDLLPPEKVDSLTQLVLVNAIYFKSDWNKQFEETATFDAEFRLNKGDTKTVRMMHQESDFSLADITEANCQMPYKDKGLSMLIFLPNDMEDDTAGLEKLEKLLTYEKFVEWTRPDSMPEVRVSVSLPRFKMEETYDLKEVLKGMGMVDAFHKANLSGMSPASDLFLSAVVHKAFVEVNEEGTEAAAATDVSLSCSATTPHATFVADHPFLFFIRHNATKTVVFAGRFCSPA